eukprot:11243187-Heterocapsa_arctica.AAC.2
MTKLVVGELEEGQRHDVEPLDALLRGAIPVDDLPLGASPGDSCPGSLRESARSISSDTTANSRRAADA